MTTSTDPLEAYCEKCFYETHERFWVTDEIFEFGTMFLRSDEGAFQEMISRIDTSDWLTAKINSKKSKSYIKMQEIAIDYQIFLALKKQIRGVLHYVEHNIEVEQDKLNGEL